jgi:hypothetical protein
MEAYRFIADFEEKNEYDLELVNQLHDNDVTASDRRISNDVDDYFCKEFMIDCRFEDRLERNLHIEESLQEKIQKCTSCLAIISESEMFIQFNGRKYHRSCFTCCKCGSIPFHELIFEGGFTKFF